MERTTPISVMNVCALSATVFLVQSVTSSVASLIVLLCCAAVIVLCNFINCLLLLIDARKEDNVCPLCQCSTVAVGLALAILYLPEDELDTNKKLDSITHFIF